MFTSGPETFGDILDPGEVAFPEDDPSLAELSDQVERLSTEAGTGDSAADEAASARTLAYVGIAAGLVGLIVGVITLTKRRASA